MGAAGERCRPGTSPGEPRKGDAEGQGPRRRRGDAGERRGPSLTGGGEARGGRALTDDGEDQRSHEDRSLASGREVHGSGVSPASPAAKRSSPGRASPLEEMHGLAFVGSGQEQG
nr:unnamed protein product [Digitaria exilis]